MRAALSGNNTTSIPTEDLADLARIVLTHNNLTFNGKHYLQILGTAIGTKMAPSYANIFMGNLEADLIEKPLVKPHTWHRFIDDILLIWTEGEERLKRFRSI